MRQAVMSTGCVCAVPQIECTVHGRRRKPLWRPRREWDHSETQQVTCVHPLCQSGPRARLRPSHRRAIAMEPARLDMHKQENSK